MNKNIAIIAPCFNEEIVIRKFLDELYEVLAPSNSQFTIIIVDDHSSDKTLDILENYQFDSDCFNLNIIKLKYNMGHQEAIRQGLIYTNQICDRTERHQILVRQMPLLFERVDIELTQLCQFPFELDHTLD